MTSPPYKTLADVQAWLATFSAGSSVDVRASMFDAALVQAVFALLPDSDPISLSITTVDAAGGTLTGTATILGEANSTATFAFTQPRTALLCQLTLTPPPTLQWSLLESFDVAFTKLEAQLIPNESISVVGLSFSATIQTTTTPSIAIPVSFTVPAFAGDWTLSTGAINVGSLTADGLQALAGGSVLTDILPTALTDLRNFSITGFEMAFNPTQKTCALIRAGIEYAGDWKFFNDKFVVQGISFDFEILEPVTSSSVLQASLYASMEISGGPTFQVGGQFPDQAVFARLAPESSLDITQVFEFLQVSLPSGFPEIDITTLSFTLFASSGAFDFQIAIAKPVPIIGSVSLDNFSFDMGASYDDTSKTFSGHGSLATQFTVGSSMLALSGSYAQNAGVKLTGMAKNIPVGDLISKLAHDFGVDDVPAPISKLVLETLTTSLDTDAGTFTFDCEGTTTIADVNVDFTPNISVTYDKINKTFTGDFTGTLVLETQGDTPERITFTVEFSKTATDTSFTATWDEQGGELDFQDIAGVFGFTLPPIPSDLDLALTAAGFTYDFTTKALAFGVESKTYGKAAFVSLLVDGKRQFFFLLDTNQSFSLSNLPLVGEELAKVETISVDQLQVVIASVAPVEPGATLDDINTEISRLKGGYPTLASTGLTGTFVVSAAMQFGSEALPLTVSLGGSSESQTTVTLTGDGAPTGGSLATTPAAPTDSSSNNGGVTWFNVQRSFGPVSIGRIGVMYQSSQQALWFELDATLAFGPLSLSLVGLGIGSPLESFAPMFSLQGLGVAYANPPLSIAGSLINLAPPGADYIEFEGGVIVSTSELSLQAFGYYGNKQGFSSMFIFGDLAYPIGGPPAFFVTGVALGFGYNSDLRLPTIDQVQSFPFVQVLPGSTSPNTKLFGPNPTPTSVLDVIMNTQPPWVTAVAGSLWFGAGITFTSYELVNSQAMLFVEVGDELVIALIGSSHAQFPQQPPGGNLPVYANIELDLEIRFAPTEGVFSVQAVLASSSFVLDPACVLTGGFAFFVWFGNNPHAGDFVLTLGGYNPGFKPPSYYPAVPLVGFHWSMDSSITISGGAYFALTPAALMVGGRLDATYQSGNLKAWFDAHADVIVRWKPFWFDANIGITVGASYKLDLLFTSATVTVELGCDLEFWGPPTGGSVTVDWYVISFTIAFGHSKQSGQSIHDWSDVEAMLPNSSGSSTRNVLAATPTAGLTPSGTRPSGSTTTSVTGLAAGDSDSDDAAQWLVRGGQFAFTATTPIPASSITVGTLNFNGSKFDVYPLGWQNITSTLTLTLTDSEGNDVSSAFQIAVMRKAVPASLWGAPPSQGGKQQVPSASGLLVPDQLVGVALQVNPPQIGASAGPVDVESSLAFVDLELPNADLPLSNSAQPTGDVPVNSGTTIGVIANADSGIGSASVTTSRNAIFAALGALGYAPATTNDPMTNFAKAIGCALDEEPLLVA